MQPDTRQTLIGSIGLTTVMVVALTEGYNGRVTTAYILAQTGLISTEALDGMPSLFGGS